MKLKKTIIFLILICLSMMNQGYAGELSLERQSELKHLLLHDCGSCHGMTMKGGLGPALTVEALSNKSKEDLFHIINNGRAGTPMPPWKNILNEADVHWLVSALKKGIEP